MKEITQIIKISAKPIKVYNALMDEKKHSQFTGAPATIESKVGGKFEVWDSYATGEIIELIRGKKIVESWRASDWPEGDVSEVTFELLPENEKTKLVFTQKNVPDSFANDVRQGWINFYWQPLNKYFEK